MKRWRVVLMGLRGSGKTVVGEQLARRLTVPFYDSDDEIARDTGRSPAEWIEQEGEPAFREAERLVVSELAEYSEGVLALGGGAPLSESNRRALGAWDVVLLDAPDSVLADRIEADGLDLRPALSEVDATERCLRAEVERQRRDRAEAYTAMNPLVCYSNVGTPAGAAREIAEALLSGEAQSSDEEGPQR